ncbi:all3515 family Zur-repressed PEP-CTERM protein [Paludisphaera soli]|uniref:all3515 family Zur-repressed PEP-CTERM protein n=1 Tax=Paludisphaera soli TaxID=2712865 RepID=UPI0013EB66F8|nr:all3515 family Zur-repressed PEP-CTERM protein [Paludisphaera soli]
MKTSSIVCALALLGAASSTRADMVNYYIGVDSLATIASGTYAGLANPNAGRLTLLYNHGDHYHSKGIFVYTGPNVGVDTEVRISPSNYLPEGSAPPFALTPGSGVFAGMLVSGQTPDVEGSDIRFGSVDALMGFPADAEETILLNSSGGRWNGSIAQADLVIELVGATAGLSILDASGHSLFGAGSTLALGLGVASLDFAPIFAAAAPGDYVASFRLRDLSGTFGDSGVFEYRFNAAVPEPGSLALSAIGGLVVSALALRNRLRTRRRLDTATA